MLLKLDAASDPTVHPGRGSAPNDMRESVAAEIVRLRRLMKSLRPGALIERGLEGAIRDHLGEITVGHDVDYQLDVELTHRFIPELETVIYRAVQAAVSGALARTDVTRLSVRLRDVGTAVDLVVEDNHAGDEAIDFAALRERISMFEGTLDVGGVPGEGSCVHVVIPTGIAA
jgi:two-component system sensor histidine kinase NreB